MEHLSIMFQLASGPCSPAPVLQTQLSLIHYPTELISSYMYLQCFTIFFRQPVLKKRQKENVEICQKLV